MIHCKKRCQIFLSAFVFLTLAGKVFSETPAGQGQSVLVLRPLIAVEDAYTETPIDNIDAATKNLIVAESFKAAETAIAETGFSAILNEAGEPGEPGGLLFGAQKRLIDHSNDLVKTWKEKETYITDFETLKKHYGSDEIIVMFIKIKLGSTASWDFVLTGSMTPGSSSTSIKAAKIDLRSGKINWTNSVIERDAPNRHNIKPLLNRLFEQYPTQSGQQEGK